MINQLLNICLQFVEVNALLDKLSRPDDRIDLEDLMCLAFDEYKNNIPLCETEFWALKNMADQANDLWAKPEGSIWAKYESVRKTRRDIESLQAKIDSVLAGEVKAVWEP